MDYGQMTITEDIVELAAIETLQELGWSYLHGSVIAPDGSAPERRSFGDVVLPGRLEAAIARINPDAPEATRAEAMRRVLTGELPDLVEENRRIHKLLTEGVEQQPPPGRGGVPERAAGGRDRGEEAGRRERDAWRAFNQLQTYKAQIPSPFAPMPCWSRPTAWKRASAR
jgi:hypothetical protein